MKSGDWMQTITGRKFWPIDPCANDVDLYDIAWALSMMCRFNGHCTRFYSVAEHSVYVSLHVPQEYALWGLLHDASEAYIADIVKPAKPFIAGYAEAENRIMRAVCERFGMALEMPAQVKTADCAILADEAAQIMGPKPSDWNLPFQPTGQEIIGHDPETARLLFLQRYYKIKHP
jgi:hypothetical protein